MSKSIQSLEHIRIATWNGWKHVEIIGLCKNGMLLCKNIDGTVFPSNQIDVVDGHPMNWLTRILHDVQCAANDQPSWKLSEYAQLEIAELRAKYR